MKLRVLLAATLAVLSACKADAPTLASPEAAGPSLEVQHASTSGYPGFYFYNGIIPGDTALGTFDGGLSPTVRICRMTGDTCGSTLATFTKTSGTYGRLVTVNAGEERYQVDWPTNSTNAQTGQIYRVSVTVGTRLLGFMDVKMVSSWAQFFATDPDEYIPWFAGSTLPIYFRIETGIPGSITVSTASINLNVGAGVNVSATLRDLYGNAMADTALWWLESSVVRLDSGMVVGQTPGTATLYAWYYDIEVQIPVTVTDTRLAWTTQTTPDREGSRGAWGAASNNVYVANHTGLLRYNGTSWTHQAPVRWRSLYDVWGSAANNVWAVGDKGEMVRYDGTSWSLFRYDGTSVSSAPLSNFATPARSYTLRGVWGSSASNVFAVGDSGVVLRYNGTSWSRMTTGTTAQLNRVWGSGASDVYAATATGRLLRYNGTAWSFVSGVQAAGALASVWGTAANNVYAVGAEGTVFRYNGTTWSRIRLPTRQPLYAVWGSGASNVFVGGGDGALYRYDGTNWIPEKAKNGTSHIQGLWGASSTDVWATGAGGLIVKR